MYVARTKEIAFAVLLGKPDRKVLSRVLVGYLYYGEP
jgi:hypothetical protein